MPYSAQCATPEPHLPSQNLLHKFSPKSHYSRTRGHSKSNRDLFTLPSEDNLSEAKSAHPFHSLKSTSSRDGVPQDRPDVQTTKDHLRNAHNHSSIQGSYSLSGRMFSAQFPEDHQLDPQFVEAYQLEDELGSGGYGFVMTARGRDGGDEVAVKFIIKEKVPDQSWAHDPAFGRLPMEALLLSYANHEGIVKCLDLFEDPVYFYLVQELHGAPWKKSEVSLRRQLPENSTTSSATLSTPSLSPSASETSLVTLEPRTPPHLYPVLPLFVDERSDRCYDTSSSGEVKTTPCPALTKSASRPENFRRPSYDLFECIEQSEAKRLSEEQARYVFSQVVNAVHYLHGLGISHRDIKDENLVIDQNLKVKLIDFGSAIIVDPTTPRPHYDLFYGTAAYASSEILLKKKYQAAPAEVWTLGILLSYLLTGISPFPTIRDAVDGKIFLSEALGLKPSECAMDLMKKCLDPNPDTRTTIEEVKTHPWLQEGKH